MTRNAAIIPLKNCNANKNFKVAAASIISAAIIFSAYNFLTAPKEIETPAPSIQIEKVSAVPLKPAAEEKNSAAIIFSAYNFLTAQKEIETPAPSIQIEKVSAAPLKPAAEEKFSAPVTATEKNSPFSADDLKISSTAANNSKIAESPPLKINLENSASDFRIKPYNIFGKVETELYFNGKVFDQFQKDGVKISQKDLKKCQILLHIANNTNAVWENSSLEVKFKMNFGGEESSYIKELQPLPVGEVVNLKIPMDSYEVADITQKAWLQIYLRGDEKHEKHLSEKYWCVVFEFTDAKDRFDKVKEEEEAARAKNKK